MALPIVPNSRRSYHGDVNRRRGQSEGAAMAWQRGMSTLAYMVGFGLIAVILHEFFHFVTLRALGGDGYITFNWGQGLTHFTEQPTHLWAVYLSGGLLTGVFFLLVFWFWAWSSRTVHDTNVEVAAFAWALGSLAYAPTELLPSSPTIGLIAFAIGFSTGVAVYFMKMLNWLASPEERGLADQAVEKAVFSVDPSSG